MRASGIVFDEVNPPPPHSCFVFAIFNPQDTHKASNLFWFLSNFVLFIYFYTHLDFVLEFIFFNKWIGVRIRIIYFNILWLKIHLVVCLVYKFFYIHNSFSTKYITVFAVNFCWMQCTETLCLYMICLHFLGRIRRHQREISSEKCSSLS